MELKFDQGRGYNFEARLELYANEIQNNLFISEINSLSETIQDFIETL